MNIYLIPYTSWRHVVLALPGAAAGLLAWFATLVWIVGIGPRAYEAGVYWPQSCEGPHYLATVSGAIAMTSLIVEGSLQRQALRYRVVYAAIAGGMAYGLSLLATWLLGPIAPYVSSAEMRTVLSDPNLVALRLKAPAWALAGMASGFGPMIVRAFASTLARRFGWGAGPGPKREAISWRARFVRVYEHLGGGLVAGLAGASVWHVSGHYQTLGGDMYLGAALGPMVWGAVHGLLVWGIPDDLYAGWIRVLSAERYGLRIPVPSGAGGPSERFIGHFPRGLDMYLPLDRGVAELHASILSETSQDGRLRYAARGLSVHPIRLKRPLEWVDLTYQSDRPAPVQTYLAMEDRLLMGDGEQTEVEFLLLPREEQ